MNSTAPEKEESSDSTTPVISIRNLSKSFNKKDFILNDLNLNIPKGKITIIIGFSGTGKSVLLKLIFRLIKPSSGKIEVFSKDIWNLNKTEFLEYRHGLGVLFQSGGLFDDMTVLENICFPLQESYKQRGIRLKGMNQFYILEKAKEKLKQLNLSEKDYDKYPEDLSGGMRKRVALARALTLNPEILFYDEPTTGLDPILTEMVNQLIKTTHSRVKDRTSVVISHDMTSTFQIGDFIVMLDKGKVVFSGKKEDFFHSDIELVRQFVQTGLRKT